MKRTSTEKAYIAAAVENASSAELVMILIDLLVSDLKNAIAAMEVNDIEKRTEILKHGFLVLQQLQASVDMENGGEAAVNFTNFYSAVRCQMLEAQIKKSTEILKRQIELLLDVRQAWQQVTTPAATAEKPAVPSAANSAQEEQSGASWTA